MSEELRKSSESIRSSVRMMRSKLVTLRADFEALQLEFDKSLEKVNKLEREADFYSEKLTRRYERRCRAMEREIRAKVTKELRESKGVEIEESFDPEKDIHPCYVGTTALILTNMVQFISGGNEGFEMMCYSVIYPCVFKNLMGENYKDYSLFAVPKDAEEVVDLGREFAKDLIKNSQYQLNSQIGWDSHIDGVVSWWKNLILPIIYQDGGKNLSFDEDPLSLEVMEKWKNDDDRVRSLPEVYDVYSHMRGWRSEVQIISGVEELTRSLHKRYGRVNF